MLGGEIVLLSHCTEAATLTFRGINCFCPKSQMSDQWLDLAPMQEKAKFIIGPC